MGCNDTDSIWEHKHLVFWNIVGERTVSAMYYYWTYLLNRVICIVSHGLLVTESHDSGDLDDKDKKGKELLLAG